MVAIDVAKGALLKSIPGRMRVFSSSSASRRGSVHSCFGRMALLEMYSSLPGLKVEDQSNKKDSGE